MKKLILILMVGLIAPFAIVHAEEMIEPVVEQVADEVVEIPSSTDPVRAEIEALKENYNETAVALDASYKAGDITAEQYQADLLAANDLLIAQLAPLGSEVEEIEE